MRRTSTYKQRLLTLICTLTLAATGYGQPLVLEPDQPGPAMVSLTEYLGVLEDPTGLLTLAEVQSPSRAGQFVFAATPAEALNMGNTRSTFWLRLQLDNRAERVTERVLEIRSSDISRISVFRPGSVAVETGAGFPLDSRAYANRFFVFPLQVPAKTQQLIFLRVSSQQPLSVQARLWEAEAFHRYERNDYQWQALYFGLAIAIVLFNLLLYVSLGSRIYLLYVFSCASMVLAMVSLTGLGKEFLWPDSQLWANIAGRVGASVSGFAMLLFAREMLNSRRVVPHLDRLLRLLALAWILVVGGFFLAPRSMATVFNLLLALTSLAIVATALVCAARRQRSAYFFLLAFSFLALGAVVTSLRGFGLLPTHALTIYAVQIGSAIEMILMAFALADRFNLARREQERAQTARLLAEQQLTENLRTSERQLEARVEQRTAELTKSLQQLRQTQAELLNAEKLASLGALVAGVAHELNTPIGNALTTASSLEHSTRDFQQTVERGELRKSTMNNFVDNAIQMTELISRSCQRAATLIGSFKQVAVDQTSEQRRRFDLRKLVDDNINALRPSFKQAPWQVEVDIADGIEFDSYPGPLGQVITNLLQNALKHGFEGREHGQLKITANARLEVAELQVADDGNGMPADVLARIFEPFYTTRMGQGGSGLGLSISRNIVTGVLGGTLTATSQVGYGSQFSLLLPLSAPNTGVSAEP